MAEGHRPDEATATASGLERCGATADPVVVHVAAPGAMNRGVLMQSPVPWLYGLMPLTGMVMR